MNTLLVGFGDSWTFGSELDRPQEQSWVNQLSDMMGYDSCINMGVPSSSIGHLTVQLFDFIKQNPNFENYKITFMVGLTGLTRYLIYSNRENQFVNITPEAVYKTNDIHHSGKPPEVVTHLKDYAQQTYRLIEDPIYNEFLVCQQIFQFQQFCNYNEIDCLFFSYFDPLVISKYNHMIVEDLIYPKTITQALTGEEYQLPNTLSNQYFEGKLFHPNLHGHTRIAELLKEFYDQKYPRY